ncbi:hypothetical protein [Brevundimonas sp.]|uniref:hypothetical protein n=1 Tax=Brevundimonas sp. TaxID=1871086 RepID=UPI002D33AA6B|nr:hypothetical protein [Brevundimonas sp.]HYC97247.1 hypothetical protein [Brevundimonas sp.]
MIVIASLLVLASQSVLQSVPQAAEPAEATELGEIVVVGDPATGLLTVVVDGEADVRTLVTSEPDLRCGPDAYRWEEFGRPRLCWLRRRLDSTVVLSAAHPGRAGSDWTVDWEGCDRVVGPDRCEVAIQPTRHVRATFRRPG